MSKNLTPRYIIIALVLAWALLTLWPSIKYQQLSPEDIQYMRETGTLEDLENKIIKQGSVSYTHLTLPTILRV